MLISSVTTSKADLRSAQKICIQKGCRIKLLRVTSLIFLDITALILAWKFTLSSVQEIYILMLTSIISISIITMNELYKAGLYRRNYLSLIKSISLSEAFILLITFYFKAKINLFYDYVLFWVFSIIFACTGRFLFDFATNALRSRGIIHHSVLLIADSQDQDCYISLIEKQNCFAINKIADSSCLDLKNREATFKYLQNQGIEEAFVSWDAIKNRIHVGWNFHTAGITLRILSADNSLRFPNAKLWIIDKVLCLTVRAPLITGSAYLIKRCFDTFAAIILLIILLPVYAVISVLIKLDSPGPIFYRQNRNGLHGKNFKIWKFRTMVADAEKLQASLESRNEIKDGVLFKIKDDPRVTKVGKFLRAYSLDELPQIFNVLLGDMSLVGPRPLATRDAQKLQQQHLIRQEVLPGITGLWQVSGRSDIDNFSDGVKLDIAYIERWSLWLDFKILLKTISVVLNKTGAY